MRLWDTNMRFENWRVRLSFFFHRLADLVDSPPTDTVRVKRGLYEELARR